MLSLGRLIIGIFLLFILVAVFSIAVNSIEEKKEESALSFARCSGDLMAGRQSLECAPLRDICSTLTVFVCRVGQTV